MNLKNKKVLVTGAGGFIGSHLVEALVKNGSSVRAFVRYNSFNRWGWLDYIDKDIKGQLEIFAGDIRDPYGVKKAMEGESVVMHLAALIGIPYSYHSPETYVDTNIKGTLNILQAARELGVEKIIHTSTSEIYGTAQTIPIAETHPVNPQSPYAATKAGADLLAKTFYNSFKLPVAIIRPFNTYGPRQSARAIIPAIITQIKSGAKNLKIGSLEPTRDFTYVADTVAGFIKAAESEESIGRIINIGSNFEISIRELVKLISDLMSAKVNVETDEIRIRPAASEVQRLRADNEEAKEILGWQAKYSLKEGLQKTIEWFSESSNLAFYKPDIYNI